MIIQYLQPLGGKLNVHLVVFTTLLLFVLESEEAARAQGIERESMAGENAAESSLNTNVENQPYNFQVGPVNLRVEAGAGISYNDNIQLADTGRESDLILQPSAAIHALWQATQENALTLDLGISYQHYFEHSTYDAFLISPDTLTQFNLFVGDFKINLHDAFSYQDNPVQVGQLSNVPQFSRFTNDAGIKVDWDLGDIVTSLAYDHTNFWVFTPAYEYLNYQSDSVSPQLTYNISKTIQAGLTSTLTDLRYDQNFQNNYTEVKGGPFVTAQLTNALSVNAQAGWDYADYDHGGLNGDSENVNSYYASLGITHRINDVLVESLTAGQEFLPGITSNYTKRIYAQYAPAWQATSAINLGAQFWWENLDDSNATFRENSNRYGAGLSLNYAATDHVTLGLSYNYVLKISDLNYYNYSQNLVSLQCRYAF
jgi:hypothetical protein